MSTTHTTIRATDLVAVVANLLEATNAIGATAHSDATRRFCDAEAACLRNVLAAFHDHAGQVERNAGRVEGQAYAEAEKHAEALERMSAAASTRYITADKLAAAEQRAVEHGEYAAQAQSVARQASEALRTLQRI